jgi:alkaline phosphatase
MSTVVIEPREDEIAKEEGKSEEEEEEEEPDVVLSGGTSFDNISKLRGKLSLEPSGIRSSEHISSTSIVRDEEKASRTNFINTRKSWKQVRRENQENAHKSLGMPNSDPEAKSS